MTAAETRDTPKSLWHNKDFLKFWVGETLSVAGSQVTSLAFPLTAVLVLDATAQQIGWLSFLQLVPALALALPLGVLVDRHRRKPAMLTANAARMLLIGLIPALALAGALHMWVLFVVAFGAGVATVLYDVSFLSFVPVLVEDRRSIIEANSKLGASMSGAQAAGPGIGGALVSALTAPVAMLVDAGSYLVSLGTLVLIRTPEPKPARPERRHLGRELLAGLRFVVGNRYLRAVAVVGALCNFFVIAVDSIFVLYAVRDKGLSALLLGVILTMGAVGGVVGSLVSGRFTRRFTVGRAYVGFLVITFLAPLLIPAAAGPEPLVVTVFAAAFLLNFLGVSGVNVIIVTLRQVITPMRLMGRMNSAMRTLLLGMGALGGPFAGLLGGAIGVHAALWVCALGSSAILVPLLLSPVGRLREMPEAVRE
ncbi:MFS transporter [Amycolatopsis acidicola]|uniref:MFS transporter n=1 Tax=Amycolatopsis acidicola TaxID=2596893 RepID=A0A5N0V3L7_9PSEU|nr:MFS transporter [Amycolatopsis acidicola]KAA9159607.1 MFS transporter [Amycolatopsis acidicola]